MSKGHELLQEPVATFIAATALKHPTPGGGSVAGVVGALGTALGEMALAFSRGKKSLADHADTHEELSIRLQRAREMFLELLADDVAAYGMYAQTTAMPDGPEKDRAGELSLAASIDVPRQMAKLCLAVLEDLRRLADCCTPWLVSDLLAAAVLASATTGLCDFNVRVNTKQLNDEQAAGDLLSASAADRQGADDLAREIETLCQPHLDRKPSS
jgi:methenyltetrahydrofolate cyclohydrolase